MPEFKSDQKKMIKILPGLLWTAILFFLSFVPVSGLDAPGFLIFLHSDKLVHFVLYFITGAIWAFVLNNIFKSKNIFFAWMWIVVSLSILTELGQLYFFSGRIFEVSDIVANIVGSFTGLIFVKKLIM